MWISYSTIRTELDARLSGNRQKSHRNPSVEQPASFVLQEQTTRSRSAEHQKRRAENIIRLKQLRHPMLDDVMATVAWVRELVTMIHLTN